MLRDIVAVQPLDGYRLRLNFDDGVIGEVDVSKLIAFTGVFEALKNAHVFEQVRVDSELGTIIWPNGADLDPDVLYAEIRGEKRPVANAA